jgi:formate hydrogenlyase transcriptional activator
MQKRRGHNSLLSNGDSLLEVQNEQFLCFADGLSTHNSLEGLLQTLPQNLCALTSCENVALFYQQDEKVSLYSSNGDTAELISAIPEWRQTILPKLNEQRRPLIVAFPDQKQQYPDTEKLFYENGVRSLCVLPLRTAFHRLGALCIALAEPDGFSEKDVPSLTLIADYVALAIDDQLNFAHSEAVRFQLESERTKLKLILDLNSSVVSNLELRDVLQAISPGIRKVMRLDGVVLFLPDEDRNHLQTHALDFPGSKGLVRQDISSPLNGSLPGQVFRSGKPCVGNIGELQRSGFDHRVAAEQGVETLCMLPLVRCDRVLGVLCLIRLEQNAFTTQDIEFLSQIAGQVAIAIDNALAYKQITELKDQLTQEKLYLEDELRTEMNFEEISEIARYCGASCVRWKP